MLGVGRTIVGKEDVPTQDTVVDALVTKSSREADLVNDLSDDDEEKSPDNVNAALYEAIDKVEQAVKEAAAVPHCVARNVPLMLK